MVEDGLPAELIGDIYEAAIDDDRWPGYRATRRQSDRNAERWRLVYRSRSTAGHVFDRRRPGDAGALPRPLRQARQWRQGLLRGPWDRPRVGYELFPERDLLKTEFYTDFARRAGMHRPMGAVLQLGGGAFATVATNRPGTTRLVEEADKPKLARVLPHMRRALQLRRAQRDRDRRASLHVRMLDQLVFGLVVCEASGRIVRLR